MAEESKGKKKGLLIILSGPSGAGKDTVLDIVTSRTENIKVSVSMTTRKKRDNEIDGVNYYFTSPEEFERNIKAGNMLEYAEYSGNYYGTPKEPVDKMLSRGINVVLKIEVQGAGNIRRIYPDAVSVFIMPKSLEILEQRLRLRSTDSQEAVLKRLKTAEEEIKRIDEYDYLIINDEIEKACSDFESIIRAEQLKVR